MSDHKVRVTWSGTITITDEQLAAGQYSEDGETAVTIQEACANETRWIEKGESSIAELLEYAEDTKFTVEPETTN